jgi:hypothetical protein
MLAALEVLPCLLVGCTIVTILVVAVVDMVDMMHLVGVGL